MTQTKLGSFIEAMFNVLIGYVINIGVQLVVYPQFGADFSLVDNLNLGLIFTVTSLFRQFVIRRWFNARLHRAAMRLAGEGK